MVLHITLKLVHRIKVWLVLKDSRNWNTKGRFSINCKPSYDEWRTIRRPRNRSAVGQIWINLMTVVWSILSSSPPLSSGSCWSEIFGLARFLHHSTWLFVLQINSQVDRFYNWHYCENCHFVCQSVIFCHGKTFFCKIPWNCVWCRDYIRTW